MNKAIFIILGIAAVLVFLSVSGLTFIDNSEENFSLGVYNLTFYNSSGFIQINYSAWGTYTSRIFSAGENVSWKNISWVGSRFGNLPNYGVGENDDNGINMSRNVLLYHFDESSGNILDYSSMGNNAASAGGTTQGGVGKIERALSFNGQSSSSYIALTNKITFLNADNWTVSFWANTLDPDNNGMVMGDNSDNNDFIWIIGPNGAVKNNLRFRNSAGTDADFAGINTTTGWHHYGLVANGTVLSLYIDGNFNITKSITTTFQIDSIGDAYSTSQFNFNGTLDEISVWNRSLNSDEMTKIYLRGAMKMNFSVRSCDDSSCSGESFAELGVNVTNPTNLSVQNNTYFQYMIEFSTENITSSPKIYNVTVAYENYTPFVGGPAPRLSFIDPTPINGASSGLYPIEINVTINSTVLDTVLFSWNGTNYTAYDSRTLIWMNFNNLSAIGESSTTSVNLGKMNTSGAIQSGVSRIARGKYGGAVNFTGTASSVINLTNSLAFTASDNWTVSFWANLIDLDNNGMVMGDGSDDNDFIWITGPNGGIVNTLRFRNSAGASADFPGMNIIGWHHYGLVANGSAIQLYVDGGLNATKSIVTTFQMNVIGGGYISSAFNFNGTLDEISVWNRSLNSDEAAENYRSTLYKQDADNWIFYSTRLNLTNGTAYSYFVMAEFNYSQNVTATRTFTFVEGGESISIDYPQNYTVFQRDWDNRSNITIKGRFVGSPTGIEARFNGGEWVSIDPSFSGGSFSGILPNQSLGQGSLDVRFSDNVDISTSAGNVGVGDVYAIGGQSNAEGRGTSAQTLNSSLAFNATVYREDDGWRVANDPTDTGTLSGSVWPLLASYVISNEGVPVAFITAAEGGTKIGLWQKGQANYQTLLNQINEATNGSRYIKAVLFFQGESDAGITYDGLKGNYALYKQNLTQFVQDITNDTLARGVVVGQINFVEDGNRTTNDNIRKAQRDSWNESNILAGPTTYDMDISGGDNLHFKSSALLQELARRWWAALDYHFYNGSYVRGPILQGAVFNTTTRNLTLTFSTPIRAGTGTQGYRVSDGNMVLTDANISTVYISGENITIPLNVELSNLSLISLGSYNDGMGKNVPHDTTENNLTAEAFFEFSITVQAIQNFFAPSTILRDPANDSYFTQSQVELNASIYDDDTNIMDVRFYGDGVLIHTDTGITNGTSLTYTWDGLTVGVHNWTVIADDGGFNSTANYSYFRVINLSVRCEAGGPYQNGALVLVQGNISEGISGLSNQTVNVSIYSGDNAETSKSLISTSDGSFQTTFSGLSGGYILNASTTYLGLNSSCRDSFVVGSPASFVLDKIATVHNVTDTTINYNITLRLINTGGSDTTDSNISDSDYTGSPYLLGTVLSNSSIARSYLKGFDRTSTTYYSNLDAAQARGMDSYSLSMVAANSTGINLTIPGTEAGQQLTLIKNAYYNSENSTSLNYTLSLEAVNSGGVNLEDVALIDSDLNFAATIDLNTTQSYNYSSTLIVEKAASNTNKLFAKMTATVNSIIYYSNELRIRIPGYGGPADTYVYAPSSVSAVASFDSIIRTVNQNPDVGQNFLMDYWITNEAESINYSSGQATVYVGANDEVNTTVSLTSPISAGNYRLRAAVSYIGGADSAYDGFEVTASSDAPAAPISQGSGGGSTSFNRSRDLNLTPVKGCTVPYIEMDGRCCLDSNSNGLCDEERNKGNLTNDTISEGDFKAAGEEPGSLMDKIGQFFIRGYQSTRGYIAGFLIFAGFIIGLLGVVRLLRHEPLKDNQLKSLIGKRVYTSEGESVGKVMGVILGDSRIYGIVVNLKKVRKAIIKRKDIQAMGKIIILKGRID